MHRSLFVFSGGCGRENWEGLLGRGIYNKDTQDEPESPYKFGVRQYIAVALVVAWAALLYGPKAL